MTIEEKLTLCLIAVCFLGAVIIALLLYRHNPAADLIARAEANEPPAPPTPVSAPRLVNAADLDALYPNENPFDSLHSTLTTSSRDWSLTRGDAWVYGVVVGWDKGSRAELAAQHGWTPEQIERLQRLHATFNAHKRQHQGSPEEDED